jgi:ABC-2 type transport system ATP-binding protein
MPAIEVTDLVVRYGEVTAVAGVSFAAEAGSVVALLGPNGAGKTSTVETLEGYRRPTSGSVRVLGLDPVAEHRAVVERIGVMLQSGGVYPSMTARDAVSLFASYYRSPEPVDGLLERVGLVGAAAGKTPWRRLSGGEQQRVSLALALVGRPSVVFLDEPTAGIDPAGRQVVRSVVASLKGDGVCVLLTTHELDEAERMADRIVIVDHGLVVADGTPAELRSGPDSIRFGAPAGLDVAGLAAAVGAPVVEVSAGEYRVDIASTPAIVAALTAWLAERNLPLADLRAGRASLEDVFLRLTGDDR